MSADPEAGNGDRRCSTTAAVSSCGPSTARGRPAGAASAGEFPFTRRDPPGYVPAAGTGTMRHTRVRDRRSRTSAIRYLLEQGQTGLSVGSTCRRRSGYDSDHPHGPRRGGKVGVAIDSLRDMRPAGRLPIDRISTSIDVTRRPRCCCCSTSWWRAAGLPARADHGTVQNDI